MKTLIGKIGAVGDVVRTTVLLRSLKGEIHWLTQDKAFSFLNSERISKKYSINNSEDRKILRNENFDLIISLEEDMPYLELIKDIRTKKTIGVFLNESRMPDYTPESSYWFDMSMISKHGKDAADRLKMQNRKSVPKILTEMVGSEFNGQEYDIGIPVIPGIRGKVGLIDTCTGLWANKNWTGYDELSRRLDREGYLPVSLGLKPTLQEHINEINSCEAIVCGDTLGMHIALALKKKIVTLFNCTSPYEIEGYGLMRKIVSPVYEKYFYSKSFNPEAISAISVDEVYRELKDIL
jgi:heptosyltransferase-2